MPPTPAKIAAAAAKKAARSAAAAKRAPKAAAKPRTPFQKAAAVAISARNKHLTGSQKRKLASAALPQGPRGAAVLWGAAAAAALPGAAKRAKSGDEKSSTPLAVWCENRTVLELIPTGFAFGHV